MPLYAVMVVDYLELGVFDVLVGINLLREGLDIPEVSLVAILDADKEGFLRSDRSLIQTVGRAARNVNGKVIMYADSITGSMQKAIDETNRRRAIQQKYNTENGLIPKTIKKEIRDVIEIGKKEKAAISKHNKGDKKLTAVERERLIAQLSIEMKAAAAKLEFEQAAYIRDKIKELRNQK